MGLQPDGEVLVSDIFPAKRKPNLTPQVGSADTQCISVVAAFRILAAEHANLIQLS